MVVVLLARAWWYQLDAKPTRRATATTMMLHMMLHYVPERDPKPFTAIAPVKGTGIDSGYVLGAGTYLLRNDAFNLTMVLRFSADWKLQRCVIYPAQPNATLCNSVNSAAR